MIVSDRELVGCKLSDFYVEKHEYPSDSKQLSELPIRIWIMTSGQGEAIEIYLGPAGDSIKIGTGTPAPVDMEEYGRTLILPQFYDENLRAQSVLRASIDPFDDGEILIMQLSDGSKLSYACYGDDALRPSIDQSKIRD